MAETIREWAKRRRVSVSLVKQLLRNRFPGRDYRSPEYRLDADETDCLGEEFSRRVRAGEGEVREADTDEVPVDDPIRALEISQVGRVRGAARSARFQLHAEFVEWLADSPPPSQRAAVLRALECIAAHGRPNRVKGVRGVNQGWLRTPVGGTSGMQWYLWFAGRGAKPVGERVGTGEFLIRAVRHHDDTGSAIAAGDPSDWMPWTPQELIEEYDKDGPESACPLSAGQVVAAGCRSPVQIVRGTPGAGKTTALLHGVRRLEGRVLYMTFGRALAERARSWLRSFVADAGSVDVRVFADVLGVLGGNTVPKDPSLEVIRAEFSRALGARMKELGPWCDGGSLDHAALFDELHGQVVGRVTASEVVGLRADPDRVGLPREDTYVAARSDVIGEPAARAAWRAATFLDDTAVQTLFAGPFAARRAIERLRSVGVPTGVPSPDWIVVDEAQDLTLVELEAIVEFARAVAKSTGKRPGVRFAGDEGQTLRPTGFTWADLKLLLSNRLADPETTALDCNLRSAREVALFVEQLTRATYPRLRKGLRPGGQRRVDVDPVEGGEIAVLRTAVAELPRVLEAVKGAGAVIQPGRELPRAVADASEASGVLVHTGESAKGLDFDSVVVLGLGDVIARMHALAHEGDVEELAAERARSLADHARVAASRAVNRLVLVEDDDPPRATAAAEALAAVVREPVADHQAGGQDEPPEPISIDALEEILDADTGDSITRLFESLRVSEEMLDRDPAVALRRADEAAGWLRRTGRSAAVADEHRRQVHRQRARAHVALAVQSILEDSAREHLHAAQRLFRTSGDEAAAGIVGDLARVLRPDEGPTSVARLREAIEARDAADAAREDNEWLVGLVLPAFGARTVGLGSRVAPEDPVQARAILALLDRVQPGDDDGRREIDEALLKVLAVLARSAPDARAVLQLLASRSGDSHLGIVARALTVLRDPGAPAAWVVAGDKAEGLATLRGWGTVRDAAAFAAEHTIPVPAPLAAAISLLDALEAVPAGELTAEEVRTLQDRVEETFPDLRTGRGRRSRA